MNFSAEYQLTFEEFKELSQTVNQRYRRRVLRGRVVPTWIISTLFILSAAGFLFFLTHNGRNSISFTDMVSGGLPIFGFIMLWLLGAFLQRWNVDRSYRRAWDTSPFMHRPTTIHITETRITTSQATAQQQYGWDHFIYFDETPGLFLLFIAEHFVLEIPKRIFDDEKIEEQARGLFQREITRMTRAFPVVPLPITGAEADQNELH